MKKAASKALSQAKEQANAALSASTSAPEAVTDGGSAELAAEVLVKVSKARKEIDAARKKATEPSREETDEINNEFNEVINGLKGREAALKKELDDWEEAEEKRLAEERRKAEEEAARKQVEADEQAREEGVEAEEVEVADVGSTGALKVGGGTVGGAKTWTAEITDVAEIPHEFLVKAIQENPKLKEALEVVLRTHAKTHKDKASIPGVAFSQKRHRTIR